MTNVKKNVELQDTDTFFQGIFNLAGIGIVTLKLNKSIEFSNLEALKIFGYQSQELNGINFLTLFHNDSQDDLENLLSKFNNINTNNNLIIEASGLHKDNFTFPVELIISWSASNKDAIYTIIIRDITTSKKNEENLKHQAYFDQLTKIPNRTLFLDRAENALNQAKRSEEFLAIIFIDLDEFKEINDTLGHEAGDIMLKVIAQRFIKCARNTDTVSRQGGDEFAILMPRIKNIEDAAILAERILESNKENIRLNNKSVHPKTSIGISVFPNDGDTVSKLIKTADMAMYIAKERGRNQFCFYKSKEKDSS